MAVKIQYPLKQGLKQVESEKCAIRKSVKIQYPLKQGLKLHRIADLLRSLRRQNSISTKTRIETFLHTPHTCEGGGSKFNIH